jgi:hypothetical protein
VLLKSETCAIYLRKLASSNANKVVLPFNYFFVYCCGSSSGSNNSNGFIFVLCCGSSSGSNDSNGFIFVLCCGSIVVLLNLTYLTYQCLYIF